MKVYSTLPAAVNKAIRQNMPKLEFVQKPEFSDIILPEYNLPVKLGEILDFIITQEGNTAIGGLRFNLARKTISSESSSIELTEKEAEVINYLLQNKNNVSREELVSKVWGYSKDTDTNTVESHIYRLRQKISAGLGKEIIISENGNYKLVAN